MRNAKNPLTKTRRLDDGTLLSLLVQRGDQPSAEFDKQIYEGLVRLQEQLTRAMTVSVIAWGLALFAYLGLLKGVSAGGLEFAERSFSLIAIILVGPATFWASATMSKVSYLRVWFSWRFNDSPPSDRATLLLRFPEAYWFFSFLPSVRGFPADVWPKRNQLSELLPIALVTVALLAYTVGGFALFGGLAYQVWMSSYPNSLVARAAVIAATMLLLLSWSCRVFTDFKRTYVHYGLVSLLQKLPEEEQRSAHHKILKVRARMGLD